MYIHEAVKIALKEHREITREGIKGIASFKLESDKLGCCLFAIKDNHSATRWQPGAEELIADDWIVLNE